MKTEFDLVHWIFRLVVIIVCLAFFYKTGSFWAGVVSGIYITLGAAQIGKVAKNAAAQALKNQKQKQE